MYDVKKLGKAPVTIQRKLKLVTIKFRQDIRRGEIEVDSEKNQQQLFFSLNPSY